MEGLHLFFLLGEVQDEGAAEGGEVAVEGLMGVGGDEEEGAVGVGVFPGVFDGGAGLADAAHAVDGALALDDDGAFGGEVLAEFGEELIAAFEQGAEGGVGEVGGLPCEDGDFKLDGLDGLLQAARGIGGLVPLAEGAVGVPAVLGELGDEGLLPLGQLRWLGGEGGEERVAQDYFSLCVLCPFASLR